MGTANGAVSEVLRFTTYVIQPVEKSSGGGSGGEDGHRGRSDRGGY